MKNGKIGVGIIGLQKDRSWAARAHIPALRALPDYEVVAVSTTRQASADAAAQAYGIPHAFDNHAALVASPDVDVVVVSVKVPYHYELVTAAIEAGKHVYCEWPLGKDLDEAVRMTEHARAKGVHGAVGLQARSAPAVNYVRDLVAEGYVGEVLSTTLVGSGTVWGSHVHESGTYLVDRANGATMTSIPLGHTVDALCYALGEIRELSATTAVRRKTVTVVETGASLPVNTADQVTFGGVLESGAVISVHYRGGTSRGTNLLWEINGTRGDLQITAAAGHAQMIELTLKGADGDEEHLQPLTIPEKYVWAPRLEESAFNVAQAYASLARDLRDGTRTCPTFEDAVIRHRMIAAIEESAASGRRQRPDDFQR